MSSTATPTLPAIATVQSPPAARAGVNAGEQLRRGGALAIASQALKLVLQLGSMAVLARLLLPADFGLWSLAGPIVAFFTVFRDLGLTAATIYSEDITDDEVTSLFWINVVAGLVIGLGVLALAPVASALYVDSRLLGVLAALAVTFVLNGIAAQYQALFQRRFRWRALAAIDVGSNLFGTAVGIGAALAGCGYWSLVWIPIATQASSVVATMLVSPWQPGRPRWERRTLAMARFGSAIAGFNVLNYFARNLDKLLIGKYWGLDILGFYGRAYSLMMAPLSQVIYPLNQVVVPVLTRINGDREAYRATYRRVLTLVVLGCAPLVTWLLVCREWTVALMLGPGWEGVVPIFLPLGFAALVQPVNNSAGWLLLSQGRSRDVLIWGVLSSALTVLSIVAGLPWGATAVAIGYALGQVLVLTPLLWWFACRNRFVRMGDLAAASLPILGMCAVVGASFEALHRLSFASRMQSWPPLASMAVGFLWVFGLGAALLASSAYGRRLLRTAWLAARAFTR
jgi:O-antigen/teichoic acid export membrane protein